jgi:hypothetical protein
LPPGGNLTARQLLPWTAIEVPRLAATRGFVGSSAPAAINHVNAATSVGKVMLVDLIEKLIDRCIGLVKEHEETKRHFLQDFVEPIYAEFQSVHDGYLACFEDYRAVLRGQDVFAAKVAQLEDKLRKDNLFTAGQRAKLLQFSRLSRGESFGNFVGGIRWYLTDTFEELVGTHATDEILQQSMRNQSYRNSLARELSLINDKQGLDDAQKQKVAIHGLDRIVYGMQERYGSVTEEYIRLKSGLTT